MQLPMMKKYSICAVV